MKKPKIVVAYSGGLDTSVMVQWLSEKFDAEIITASGNLGQREDWAALEAKAYKTGASKAYVSDLRETFVKDYVWKALKAGALYEGLYPMATSIGRPLLAKMLADVAIEEGAEMVAHGCTGKGNDQVRFEVGIMTLAPHLKVLAPLRDWEFKSREEEIEYAIEKGIPVSATKKSPYSIDENLFGISIECGVLEDPTVPPPADAYQMTIDPKQAPDVAETITVSFENGVPTALNGESLDGVVLLEKLNGLAAAHGIGRLDLVENRVVGIKSREIYEAPAATVLHWVHSELERLVLDKETFRYKQQVAHQVSNLIYDGLWFSPLFKALMAFVDSTQERVSGTVTMEMFKGSLKTLSRTSPYSMYNEELATYTASDKFNHKASEGFIEIFGLPYKIHAQVGQQSVKETI